MILCQDQHMQRISGNCRMRSRRARIHVRVTSTARTKIPGKRMDRRLDLQVLFGRRQDEPSRPANKCGSVDDSHYVNMMRMMLI